MTNAGRATATAVLGLALTCAAAGQASTPVQFEAHRLETKPFDRFKDRPPEISGKPGDMNAVAVYAFNFGYDYTYVTTAASTRDGPRVRLRLTTFKINGKQTTTIHIPQDAGQDLKDHELGHHAMYDAAYAAAKSKAVAMCDRMVRREFEATTVDDAKSQMDAFYQREFCATYRTLVDAMNKDYDELTQHGANKKITAKEAARRVLAKRR